MTALELAPTLWRSCRVLANGTRLRVLGLLIQRAPMGVGEVGRVCGLGEPQTSRELRALQARGLLQASRKGRFVTYRAEADASVPSASPLLTAVSDAFARGETPERQIRALTAFTHPRRIGIVQALSAGPRRFGDLCAACRISRPALHRHLDKLCRRGVVERHGRGGYRLGALSGLAQPLTDMALAAGPPRQR